MLRHTSLMLLSAFAAVALLSSRASAGTCNPAGITLGNITATSCSLTCSQTTAHVELNGVSATIELRCPGETPRLGCSTGEGGVGLSCNAYGPSCSSGTAAICVTDSTLPTGSSQPVLILNAECDC